MPGYGDLAVAFRRGGSTAVVVTNPASRQVPATIDLGTRRGTIHFRRTSPTERFVTLPSRRYRGNPLGLDLPAQSVTTLVLRSGR